MPNVFTRRYFLGTAGAAASAALLAEPLFNFGVAEAAVPLVRRDVGRMNASDPILLAYRKAIAAMQVLPAMNPLSWSYQAAIHGTTQSGMQTAWNSCEHGTDFFWSWHRMYLYWFERIIRKMSGEPCWALPYWDWAPGSELQLPAPFRDAASELFIANRNPAINSGAGSLNPGAVSISGAFSSTDFLTANSIIQGPHGSVHVQVGGWMSSVPTAAQDPIFYLHHSNVDRQWNLWLAQGGGRSDPLTNSAWRTRQYTFFDENGSQVNMSACQILRAAEQLNYVYECEPSQVREFCRFRPPIWEYVTELLARIPIPPVELKSEPVSFPIELKPKDARADSSSAQYVGSLSLFGAGIRSEGHKEFKPAHFVYPLNHALQTALKRNEQNFPITFVPVGILIDGKPSRPEVKSPVHIGKANLLVQTRRESTKKPEEMPE